MTFISAADTPPLDPGFPGNRTCVLCPTGTWADQSGFSCVECGLENCSQCQEVYNGRCFPSPPSPSPSPSPFPYYNQHFTAAVGLCRHGNQEACQLLINLCVLQRYMRSGPFLLKCTCIYMYVLYGYIGMYCRSDPACVEVLSPSPLLRSPFYPQRAADETLSDTAIRSRLYTSPSAQVAHHHQSHTLTHGVVVGTE